MSADFERGRFLDLAARIFRSPGVDVRGVAEGWHRVLSALYAPRVGREYHCADHVENLLARLDRCRREFDERGPAGEGRERGWRFVDVDWGWAELAVWFHDAVYSVGRKPGLNEEESAQLAGAFFASVGGGSALALSDCSYDVRAAILDTRHDHDDRRGATASLVLDLDLAGFADPWDVFEENNRRIRDEHREVPAEAYRWGRLRFLSGLMSRPRIFRLLRELEEPARANVRRHAADLMAPP